MPDRYPAKDDEALLQNLGERPFFQGQPNYPGEQKTDGKNYECDKQREAAGLEELTHLYGYGIAPKSEVTVDRARDIGCGGLRELVPWEMNDDFDGSVFGEFERVIDDIYFCLGSEVAFAGGRRIQRMEQLRNFAGL